MALQMAILGFGVIGSGVAEVLQENKALIEKRIGEEIRIKAILDLRDFDGHPLGDRVVHDINVILNDPDISVVAEMMGGAHPAYDFSKACIERGKSVVTSNKEVVATFGAELLSLAREHGVRYLFEASVGGGIPIIRPMMKDLRSSEILSVNGILNGTTNYILSEVIGNGTPFSDALRSAQEQGFAERDPSADIDGIDAARKIVILAALAFGKMISPDRIHVEGISALTPEDGKIAEAFGCSVKLIAHAEKADGKILCAVFPCLVPTSNPLSGVSGVFNGILVDANTLGNVMFYGRGAGKLPTASAVVTDLIDAFENAGNAGLQKETAFVSGDDFDIADFQNFSCRNLFVFRGCERLAPTVSGVFGGAEVRIFPELDLVAVMSERLTEETVREMTAVCPFTLVKRLRVLG